MQDFRRQHHQKKDWPSRFPRSIFPRWRSFVNDNVLARDDITSFSIDFKEIVLEAILKKEQPRARAARIAEILKIMLGLVVSE